MLTPVHMGTPHGGFNVVADWCILISLSHTCLFLTLVEDTSLTCIYVKGESVYCCNKWPGKGEMKPLLL